MTQNNEREALIEDEFNKQYPYDDMNGWDRNIFKSGYQASTKASEIEINSLKERVAELQSHLSSQSIELAKNDVTLESYAHKVAALQAHVNQLREALESAIECTDDYNMIDRMDGKQYFKHKIFKHEIKLLEELRATS